MPENTKKHTSKAAKPAAKQGESKPSRSGAQLEKQLEAILLTSGEPVSMRNLVACFDSQKVSKAAISKAMQTLEKRYENSVMKLENSASGYVFQVGKEYADVVNAFRQEKPVRYSRALMETLAIIAYKQPVTRPEIEELRGVTVSASILRTLKEHEWIKETGHKDVPGRPATWGTTKTFLDNFNLKSLSELPNVALPAEGERDSEQT